MRFIIKLAIEDENGTETTEEVIQLTKYSDDKNIIGISLQESKAILKILQSKIILSQVKEYVDSKRICACCGKKMNINGYCSIQYRTLFGIVNLESPRLFHCQCHESEAKTFSLLSEWLSDKNSAELQYIETKWASLISFGQTAKLLKEVLPVGEAENAATVRNHLHNIAKRQEKELEGKPEYISVCQNELDKYPKPGKPMTVGIDGGYLKNWKNKNNNFEIIAGKSFSATQPSKRFGFVQKIDSHPKRRLMHLLKSQGMQPNQQITFLSDGADNLRELQCMMYPESEHLLDWFHITMRLTVLNQFAKGLVHSDPTSGKELEKHLESTKWYLWHGNVEKALDRIEECYFIAIDDEIKYHNKKKLIKHLEEFQTYIENNSYLITNYGEKWRYGETISTAFVEATINEVVAKRLAKKQQMQWTYTGAHYLIQTRTAVLNNELHEHFSRWFPGFNIKNQKKDECGGMKKAA
jgi:hypothetical protein